VAVEPQQGRVYEQISELARGAERLGFDGFFTSDHYMRIELDDGSTGQPGPIDAWTTLTGLALETRTIRLGTLVTPVTFRLPGPLAIAVAQIDAMSRGRVEVGLGIGWFGLEHRAYGIPFPARSVRVEMLTEYLEVLTGLWAARNDTTFRFEGRFYRLTESPVRPRLAQDSGPPIIIGGSAGGPTDRLAARFGSELNVQFKTPDEARVEAELLRRTCEEIGRDPETVRLSVLLGTTGASPERSLRPDDVRRVRSMGAALIGTCAQIGEQVNEYRAAGVDAIYLSLLHFQGIEELTSFAEEALPACR
jgi:F420-dependent oxidoreductase-like protein